MHQCPPYKFTNLNAGPENRAGVATFVMRDKEYLLYGGGCLFVMGLGLRELAL